MFEPAVVSSPNGKKRRSTRLARAVPVTVAGVDARRAPYKERVSTTAVNCHGCKYPSKYEVLQGDVVYLEVGSGQQSNPEISVRAKVKFVDRPAMSGEPFLVGAELETPGNVWGIAFPPDDWFPFVEPKVEPKTVEAAAVSPAPTKPRLAERLAVTPPVPAIPAIAEPTRKVEGSTAQFSSLLGAQMAAPLSPLMTQLASEFTDRLQQTAEQAAAAAVSTGTAGLLEELREQLRNEARRVVENMTATYGEQWARKALAQMNATHEANTRALQEQWNTKIEQDLHKAADLLTSRGGELAQRAETLASAATERLQRALEASQRDWMTRFVARLQQEVAPLLQRTQEFSTKLAVERQQVEQQSTTQLGAFDNSLRQSVLKNAAQMQEFADRLAQQFDRRLHEQISKAAEEFERKHAATARAALDSFQQLFVNYEKRAGVSLQAALEPAVVNATKALQEQAAEVSRNFAAQIDTYTRSYLEYVSGLIADLPKRIATRPEPPAK